MSKHAILQKFYVYDPGVHAGDELGGLRVIKDEKKNGSDNGLHVLAMPQMVQWWIDQGLLGREPLSKLSGAGKKLLAQVTRGRSEKPDDDPKRVPKYSRRTQSGAPSFALSSPSQERINQRKRDRAKAKDKKSSKPEAAKPAA